MITWNCDVCLLPVDDRKGYVSISPLAALRRMREISAWSLSVSPNPPEALGWATLHEACESDPEGPEYWWDIQRLRSAAGVYEFAAHLGAKTWSYTATDLEPFTLAALSRDSELAS